MVDPQSFYLCDSWDDSKQVLDSENETRLIAFFIDDTKLQMRGASSLEEMWTLYLNLATNPCILELGC